MRKFLSLLFLFSFFSFFPHPIFAEQIQEFNATYVVNKDGTVDVTESIVYDFEGAERHGIFRTIPLERKNDEGKRFVSGMSNVAVVDEQDRPYSFTQSNADNTVTLKIGDANRTITGVHTYTLLYRLTGAITYFSDHDELYWNITGTDWQVSMQKAVATVHLPDVSAADIKTICYTGAVGSTAQNCTSNVLDASVITSASLAPYEGLTVGVRFPKNVVAIIEPTAVVNFSDTLFGKIFLICIFLAGLFWYAGLPLAIIFWWWKRGRDPKGPVGAATAWFSPPTGENHRPLVPAETGTLVDERADFQDITATIIDFARRGYLHIVEKKKDSFVLVKQKDFTGDPDILPFEAVLLSGLFEKGDTFEIEGSNFVSVLEETKKELYRQVVKEGFFDSNPQTTRTLFTVLAIFGLASGNIPLAFAAFIFGHAMPRKTLAGVEAANVAKALKNFLTSQKRYLRFQAEKQTLFEKLLPYAIAFGVEEIWAGRFKDMKLATPVWYEGYSGRFTSTNFVHHLNTSFTSSVSASATPTRSSSGFSSGFSGGSSGGGGGGGGGGSW